MVKLNLKLGKSVAVYKRIKLYACLAKRTVVSRIVTVIGKIVGIKCGMNLDPVYLLLG